MVNKIYKTEEDWKKILTPEQYLVMRGKETERPFTCEFKQNARSGVYHCAACDLPLFKAGVKYDSGTGWPSFYEPYAEDHLEYHEDHAFGMSRVEVQCARCGSHLGHVFDDGPKPTGKRYCMNGVALVFKKE